MFSFTLVHFAVAVRPYLKASPNYAQQKVYLSSPLEMLWLLPPKLLVQIICPHLLILQAPIVCTRCSYPHYSKTLRTLPTQILSKKCSYPNNFKRLTYASHLNWKLTQIVCSTKCTCPHLLKSFTNASHSFLLQQGRYHRSHLTGHSSAQLSSLNCFRLLFVLVCWHSHFYLTPSLLFGMQPYFGKSTF